jgi:hypothetical protein
VQHFAVVKDAALCTASVIVNVTSPTFCDPALHVAGVLDAVRLDPEELKNLCDLVLTAPPHTGQTAVLLANWTVRRRFIPDA